MTQVKRALYLYQPSSKEEWEPDWRTNRHVLAGYKCPVLSYRVMQLAEEQSSICSTIICNLTSKWLLTFCVSLCWTVETLEKILSQITVTPQWHLWTLTNWDTRTLTNWDTKWSILSNCPLCWIIGCDVDGEQSFCKHCLWQSGQPLRW